MRVPPCRMTLWVAHALGRTRFCVVVLRVRWVPALLHAGHARVPLLPIQTSLICSHTILLPVHHHGGSCVILSRVHWSGEFSLGEHKHGGRGAQTLQPASISSEGAEAAMMAITLMFNDQHFLVSQQFQWNV